MLALLTGLKQICNHPAQFLKQADPRLAGRSPKLDLVDELVATVLAEDGAVLVFTQYVAMARLLATHLTRNGVAHQFLHGGTPVREREAMVTRFQAGEVPVFLLSLRAGGTGLTLTRADHVIHLDRWWNPAVEEQATDRAYRIGQTRPVQVHRLVTQGTIEERIAELLTRKRALADSVLAATASRAHRAQRRRPARPGHPAAAGGSAGSEPIHRRQPARRGGARASTWWGKAWVRAVEESAYAEEDLRAARTLARSGASGDHPRPRLRRLHRARRRPAPRGHRGAGAAGRRVPGHLRGAGGGRVRPDRGPARRRPPAHPGGARGGGRGELLPYSGDFAWACSCDAWLDPCPHALAVGYQLAWLVDADPLVLLGLRGLPRDDLLARLHARAGRRSPGPDDLELALDAALRAGRALELLAAGEPIDHLL